MDSEKMTERSPLRTLDKAMQGGLGKGELGVVLARHGVGKTPFVVGLALDRLMAGRRVLHVSLEDHVDHVREYYELIFSELVRATGVEVGPGEFLEMERSRRIHAYVGDTFSVDKLRTAVEFMIDHASFRPDVIVVDGLELGDGDGDRVMGIRDVAKNCDATLWMTVVRHRDEPVGDPDGIPGPVGAFKDLASWIINLHTDTAGVRAQVMKPVSAAGELPFVLDPTTMLIQTA